MEYIRDKESFKAEIETREEENGLVGIFQLPQPSLREQVRADTKYRETIIRKQFRGN